MSTKSLFWFWSRLIKCNKVSPPLLTLTVEMSKFGKYFEIGFESFEIIHASWNQPLNYPWFLLYRIFVYFFQILQFHFRIFYDKINDLEGNRGQSGDHKCWLERVIPSLITCCDTKASLELQPGECEPGPVNSRITNSKQTNSN